MTYSFEKQATLATDKKTGAAYVTRLACPTDYEELARRYQVLAEENARLRERVRELEREIDTVMIGV
jgi:hypothetical protein